MRIAFTSDLHVEYHLEVVGLLAAEATRRAPDVLLLGGDVCPDLNRLERALHLLVRALACPILFLPGNHELWCGGARGPGPHSRERYKRVLPALARRAGVLPLGSEPQLVGQVAFVGVTGWYDGSLRPPKGQGDASTAEPVDPGPARQVHCVDHAQVFWPGDDGAALSDPALARLMRELLGVQLEGLRDHVGPIVAVTHMIPHAALAGALAGTPWAGQEPYLGSAALWPVIASHPRVALSICGHLHVPRRASLPGPRGEIRCEVSPIGYPREIQGPLEAHVADRLTIVELP